MRSRDRIIEDIIGYLEVEKTMGTQWIPIKKKAASARGSAPEPERRGGEEPAATRPRPSRNEAGKPSAEGGKLPRLQRVLTVSDESEIKRREETLGSVEMEVKSCTKCPLCEARTKTVFHEGSPASRLCFVGEGPGAEEDMSGIPFVGRAGRLLTKILDAMGLRRGEVYICNTVKCRPPGNRTPTREEMETCWPYLERQLDVVKPDLIVAMGLPAAQMLVKGIASISKNRGRLLAHRGTPVMLTYHPAYLLRNPSAKKLVWEDMKKVHSLLTKDRIETKEEAGEERREGESLSLFSK